MGFSYDRWRDRRRKIYIEGAGKKRCGHTKTVGGPKIREARYNKVYKDIGRLDGVPKYLLNKKEKRKDRGKSIKALLRLRCGNMENGNKY